MEQIRFRQWARQLTMAMDRWVTALAVDNVLEDDPTPPIHHAHHVLEKRHHERKSSKGNLFTAEEDVKQLILGATRLDDIWEFFLRRLQQNGSPVDFMCFAVLDDSGDFIRVPYFYPDGRGFLLESQGIAANGAPPPMMISMSDDRNYLIQSFLRKDTTFTSHLPDLGLDIYHAFRAVLPAVGDDAKLNIFSVPFVAGNRTVALLTLGFFELDAFSQAKLSYIYTLRDQIAQLVWNLVLQDRMSSQAQMDNLTGLLTHGSFQRMLDGEIERAEGQGIPLTLMLLDLNNLQDINNTMGHHKGDEAIQYLASTARRLIRGLDTVARYGGDEVVVILPEIDTSLADEVANRFMKGFKSRLPKGFENLTVSVGYSVYPTDTRDRDELLKLAEQALHLAKFRGSKTGESTRIASREVDKLNEKTILEVFASYVARKYNHKSSDLFNTLIRHAEYDAEAQMVSIEATTEHLKLETIRSLAGALEAKDQYTRGHSQAVSNYAVALAHAMKLPTEEVEQIRLAAFLHDIGKIGIPESILCKPGPLDDKEFEIMKQHPVIGARQILAPVSSLKAIIPMVEHHHEQWDGLGHPAGLSGEAIPLGARIISIVDAFHALTSDRPYRSALSIEEAKVILEAGAGTKWDPHLIEVFFKLLTYASPRSRVARREETVRQEAGVGMSKPMAPKLEEVSMPAQEAESAANFLEPDVFHSGDLEGPHRLDLDRVPLDLRD